MVCSRKSRSSLETFLSNHRPRQVCLAALGNNSGVPWMDFGRHKTERAVAGTCGRTNSSGAVVATGSQKDFSSPVPVEPVAKQVVEGFLSPCPHSPPLPPWRSPTGSGVFGALWRREVMSPCQENEGKLTNWHILDLNFNIIFFSFPFLSFEKGCSGPEVSA